MPDAKFADPRLAPLYDVFDSDRADLDAYLAIVNELGAHRILDVGCGTGAFALLLADRGHEVIGVDPAAASLDVARAKRGANKVRFLLGDATTLPPLDVDLATMTGNVAQVFLSDTEWTATLNGIHDALRPGGHLVFESRDPARRAWEDWIRDWKPRHVTLTDGTAVRSRSVVTRAEGQLVSFDDVVTLPDGTTLTSSSTLRFREREEVEASLASTGFRVDDVRDAPDRPGLEFVFIATRL